MKKLLSREPTPEMVEAAIDGMQWQDAAKCLRDAWDAAPALPEPGEVERRLRALKIIDEVNSDNSLGRDAADLIAALECMRDAAVHNGNVWQSKNAELKAENERLREDAERYRWLRQAEEYSLPLDPDEMDAAIDAAKKEKK